jgi:hypothetical protein
MTEEAEEEEEEAMVKERKECDCQWLWEGMIGEDVGGKFIKVSREVK